MRSALESGLPLAAHCQYEHGIDGRHIVIQRHIAVRCPAYHQFALAALHGPPDLRAVDEDLQGLQNAANALGCGFGVVLDDVAEEAVEVVQHFEGQLDARHVAAGAGAYLPRVRAEGLRGRSPWAREAG